MSNRTRDPSGHPIVSRAEAMAAGAKHYFTGAPCKRGHIDVRSVSTYGCLTCQCENVKRSYHADPERGREKARIAREKDPERTREIGRAHYGKNQEARRESAKKHYWKNRDAIVAAQREKRAENHEAAIKYARDYYEKHKDKFRAGLRKASRERRATPHGNLKNRISCGIWSSLQSGKGGMSWELLVGYTLSELKVHLERQFTKGMGWHNRDKWHIDHIIPLSSFKFQTPDDIEFKAAWALTNLRPLWAKKNMSKGAKREFLL